MTKEISYIDNLKMALVAENNTLISRFSLLQDRVESLISMNGDLDDEVQELLQTIEGRLENLLNKVADLNDSLAK